MSTESVAALQSEPRRLEAELGELTAAVQALSFHDYQVHVQNAHCAAEAQDAIASGLGSLSELDAVATQLLDTFGDVESEAHALHAAHARLRRTVVQQASVTDLLELPAVLDTCVRSGLYDEALDIIDHATQLYFAHRLWDGAPTVAHPVTGAESRPGSLTDASPAAHAVSGRSTDAAASRVVRAVVADARRLAADMQESFLAQLSSRITLPVALKLLGHLRRLLSQQALARKRTAALLRQQQEAAAAAAARASSAAGAAAAGASSASLGVSAASSLPASVFTLDGEEESAVLQQALTTFLQCRDAWHRSEIDAIGRHNAYQYLLKVVDLHRSHWAEVCSGFIAVLRSLAPMPALPEPVPGVSPAATDGSAPARAVDHSLLGREMLAQWLQHRVDWFLRTLAGLLPAIDDAANLQSLLQQCTYAARRAARLGADYTHALGPLFLARVQALIADKFAVVAAQFRADVRGWQWSYKMGYEPRGDAAAAGAAPPTATAAPLPAAASGDAATAAASAPAGPASLTPPPLPQELLRVAPLADMCNGLVSAVNAVRPCLPVAAVPGLLRELRQTIMAAVESLEAATTADASPVMLLQAASARAAAAASSRGGGGSAAAGGAAVSDEDMLAIRRFVTLCTYLNKHMLPYAEQVGVMVAAGAEITDSTLPAGRADGAATTAATPAPGAGVSAATTVAAMASAAARVSPTFRELEAHVRETLASITGKIRAATA